MRKLFPTQYWLSWLFAGMFFAALVPYGMFREPEISVHYTLFCVVLGALSTVLFRAILFRVWVRRLYSESFRVYGWILAIQAFCHLVFTGMNPKGWVYIGVTAALGLGMGITWLRQWREARKK